MHVVELVSAHAVPMVDYAAAMACTLGYVEVVVLVLVVEVVVSVEMVEVVVSVGAVGAVLVKMEAGLPILGTSSPNHSRRERPGPLVCT